MKVLWIAAILIGFGFIAYGAIAPYGTYTRYLVMMGTGCMGIGILARRQVYNGR